MIRIRSVSTKIVIAYLALTVLLSLITTLSFYAIVRQVVLSEASSNLHRQGDLFAQYLANNTRRAQGSKVSRPAVQVAGHLLDVDYILVNARGMIQSSSIPTRFPAGAQIAGALPMPRLTRGRIQQREFTWQDKNYLVVRVPVPGTATAGEVLYMLTQLQGLEAVRSGLFWLAVRDSLLALAAALLLAWFFGSRLARPLQELGRKAEQIAGRDFDVRVDFRTGDEVEELGQALGSLARQLGDYDQGQRRFFQSISHELRTPLMSIRGYAEGLRDGVFAGAEADRGLDVIIKESERLQAIVDDILFLSRLKSPREVYQRERVDLLVLLQEVCTTLGGLAEDRGISLQLEGETIAVQGDREKLRRLWINILGNALRYARSRVAVSLARRPLAGAWPGVPEVRCHDDGPGFQEKDLQQLFSEFYKGQGGQTGLGLAIAQEIVSGHQGEILAQNHPDGGAEVVVRFGGSRTSA
jgi:signal transduction histidine kinase